MRGIITLLLLLVSFLTYSQNQAPSPAPIVFFDIAGPDQAVLREFYQELFHWDIAEDGNFSTAVTSPLFGAVRGQDEVNETLVYIGVEDITAKLAEIEMKGGKVDFPRLEVPGVVILGMFRDPAGNRVGLVEMENGKAKVP